MVKKLLIRLKWKYLRWQVKTNKIRFNKCMLRLYYIQELKELPNYEHDKLIRLGYSKLRKLFIKERPKEYLDSPYED